MINLSFLKRFGLRPDGGYVAYKVPSTSANGERRFSQQQEKEKPVAENKETPRKSAYEDIIDISTEGQNR